MVTYRNRRGYKEEKQTVSSFLDCECTCDQQKLLNPSVLDTVIGFVMNDSQGEGIKKRLPQRRFNFIDGMVSSHCGVLNSDKRLNLICQANEVSGVMVDLEAERLQKRDDQRKRHKKNQSQRSDASKRQKKRRRQWREAYYYV